jgi:hypothetical protein
MWHLDGFEVKKTNGNLSKNVGHELNISYGKEVWWSDDIYATFAEQLLSVLKFEFEKCFP